MTNPADRTALAPVLGLALALFATGCMDPGAPGNLVPATVEDDPSLPRIEVDGTTLHAEAFGNPSAPMIMMLRGGPGGDYRSLLPYRALADDGTYVVFWDHRGSGLSRRHAGSSYALDLYLEDLLAAPARAPAQELDLAATSTARPSIVQARTGMDHAFVGEVGYRHVLAWGDQQLFAGGDVAMPWAKADLRDHRLRVTVGMPFGDPHWKLAGWLSPTLRGTLNAASEMKALGVDVRLAGGYYAPRWFVAGEVGLDWIAATHITFSDAYRTGAYPGARDGWYRTPGGTVYTGLQAGVSFSSLDLILRAGHPRTTALEPQTVPFYLTMGVNVAL